MRKVVLSGSGLYTPPATISNEELVTSFNTYVDTHNRTHADAIARGERERLESSNVDFIERVSGIRNRFVIEKEGILDPERMVPDIPERPTGELSVQAELAVASAKPALAAAGKSPSEVDAVIVACSSLQRPYPAMAVEVQHALGCGGFAFDMNVACSSATFAIRLAAGMIADGNADTVLVVSPEICSGQINFRDRESHFIFGDASTSVVVEAQDTCRAPGAFEILGSKLVTQFSNNLRSNFGFLIWSAPEGIGKPDKLFHLRGQSVFKEVVPLVSGLILDHLHELGYGPADLKRTWLHQANRNMNDLIARKVWGREPSPAESPLALARYANTSACASIIVFHEFRDDLSEGDLGVLCSFGGGYSAANIVLKKVN